MPVLLFRRFACATALFALTCTAAFAQNTIHVPADQATIQAGINVANPGDTVLVAPGTYLENIDFLGKAITVTSSDGAAKTTIDGGGKAPAVTFKTKETRAAVLSNFTITHGGSLEAGSALSGINGGIYLVQSRPTILNNIITQNYCQNIQTSYSGPLIQGNIVSSSLNPEKCGVTQTGGIYLGGDYSDILTFPQVNTTPAFITGNTIENNTTGQVGDGGGDGGAGIAVWGGAPIIVGNIIRNNSTRSGNGGGINFVYGFGFTVVQNLIYGNSAGCGGGAIALLTGGLDSGIRALIANNTMVDNTNFIGGGGYSDCFFTAQIFGGDTGSLIVNNIIAGNTTYPQFDCGSRNFPVSPPSEVQQPIFDHNLLLNTGGSFFGTYCVDVSAKYGNASGDAQFVDPATGNYRLKGASPAIDAGNDSVLALIQDLNGIVLTKDLDGNPRLQDVTGKGYPIIDVGAYEFAGLSDASPTTIVLTSSAYTGNANSNYVMTATLASALGTPTGSVTFFLDGNQVGTSIIGSNGIATLTNFLLTPGVHSLYATYPGVGSFTPAKSVIIIVNIGPYDTDLTLSSSLNPSIIGQLVTFTATASSADPAYTPSPIVLTDNSTQNTLATLTPNSSGIATYSTSTLALGNHYITATYTGDSSHASANTAVFQEVLSGNPTTTTITSSLNPSLFNQSVTFTATLTSTNGTPTGFVQFSDGSTLFTTTQPLNALGVATFSTSTLSVGSHNITATYVPAGTFAASAASLTQVVQPGYTTTATIASSLNPSTVGQAVTFTAQLTSATGVPTGTVTFTDGANTIGTQPLDTSGDAAITTSTLTVGSHTITAAYVPSGTFASSTAALTQRVNALADTTTLTATPTTATLGNTVTLTAAVTPIATGTVAFTSNGTPLGNAPLINGAATFSTTTLPLGTDQITATYSGDTAYAPSTSNTVTVTITARPSTLTVVSAANPSPSLTPIAFTAHLLASATPASQGYIITFTITPTTPGASSTITTQLTTNAAGTTTYTNPSLLPGQYLVTATFAGTSDLLPSTATSFTETVTSNPTVTTLTASPNPGEQNEPITFTSTIIATAGAAAPIGTITLLDTTAAGTATIATLNTPVSPGTSTTVTFTTSTLPVGVHSLIAVFGPATGFVASQSQPLSLTILPQGFTLTLSEPNLTVQTGHHHTLTVMLTSIGGLTATFTHSCGALPEYVSCLWGQASVTLPADGIVSTTLTMDTDQLPGFLSSNTRPTTNRGAPFMARLMRHGWAATTAFALFPLTLFGFKRRRKLSSLLSLLLLATLATGLTACGADKYPASTPPGTYIIPVTASAHAGTAAYAQTVNLTLIVTK